MTKAIYFAFGFSAGVLSFFIVTETFRGDVITVHEDYNYQFDANSGDSVNVILNPVGDMQLRCDNMGGKLYIENDLFICKDVDF